MRLLQYGRKKCCRLTDTYGELQTPKKLVHSYSRGFYSVSRTIAPSCCNRTVGGFPVYKCTARLLGESTLPPFSKKLNPLR